MNRTVIKDSAALHEFACSNAGDSESPWHIRNLYDRESRTFFVPYHLWSGAEWDGNKDGPCMHQVSTTFLVNGWSRTTIEGPREWRGHEVWVRSKTDGSKTQYFECHGCGIGRVYEIRGGKERIYPRTGRCKFPAGYGWKLSERRYCTDTAIRINHLEFDRSRVLLALEFDWWYKSEDSQYVLDHRYRYRPNMGMTHAMPQR